MSIAAAISDDSLSTLLGRYDVPGPRYTSYPTVPDWTPDFGPAELARRLEAAAREDALKPLSLYVHVPFCREICTYCGCNVVITRDGRRADAYLDAIERELDLVAARLGDRKTLSQVHWGGGTPTFLDERQIERLFIAITRRFSPRPDAEIAIEIDPV